MARPPSFSWPVFGRSFLSLNLICITIVALLSKSGHASSPVTVTIPPQASGIVVQDNFFGISFELSPFNTLWGNTPQDMPKAMQNYLSNLRSRIKSPLRIRVGGNSMDSGVYVPDQTQMIIVTDPNGDPDDIPVNFGPMLFDVLNAMSNAVGEMQFVIGLSMRSANDTNAIELARDTRKKLNKRLDSMLMGNEPDLYDSHDIRPGYTIQDYVDDVSRVLKDLQTSPYGNLAPDTIIGGPTICCDWQLSDTLSAGLSNDPFKYYTLQHYAKSICDGPNASNQNITYFTSHTNIPKYTQTQAQGVQMANNVNVPVLMTEYNTVSCGGSNISDTFAAALWAVDAGMNFASSGMSGVHIHTREYGIRYNLFDPPSPQSSTGSDWRTGSPYYAALLLSETFMDGGSIVVDLNVDNSINDPASTVAGYALYDKSGQTRKRLVLINYYRGDNSESGTRDFTIEGGVASQVSVRILTAPIIAERTDISWAGQTVGQNGVLGGVQTTQYLPCVTGCNITVPGPGAALVLLDDKFPYSSVFAPLR
ncbi:glycoside hydrolase family 79 protein [Scleroderma yunnanense]